jgi:peptidoglycan/LPS O-acetylase OafA/YrhL
VPVETLDPKHHVAVREVVPHTRNQPLDVLRCAAILLVMGRHFPYYDAWGRIGWIGVDLFFVLSGFLISGLLYQEYKMIGKIRFGRFVFRRGFKIWPPFYFCMAITGGLVAWGSPKLFPWKGFATASLFVQSYFPHQGPEMLGPTWSLAVEEHFYLLLPIVLMLLIAFTPKRPGNPMAAIPYLFIVLSVACLAARCLSPDMNSHLVANRATHMRIDSLFAGVTLGYFYHFRRSWFQKLTGNYALAVAFVCCLPAAFLEEGTFLMRTVGLSSLFVGFSFLVAWSVVRSPRSKWGQILVGSAAKIGVFSYSIYLWHRILSILFLHYYGNSALGFWLYIVAAIVLGVAMAKLVEMPSLALRDRWQPAEFDAAVVPSAIFRGKPCP